MEPSHPYLLPRQVPTSAGVIYQKPQLSIQQNLSTSQYGGLVIRPQVEKMVSLLQHANSVGIAALDSYSGLGHYSNFERPVVTCHAGEFALVDGTVLKPFIVPAENNGFIDSDGQPEFDKCAIYPMALLSNAVTFQIKTDSAEEGSNTLTVRYYSDYRDVNTQYATVSANFTLVPGAWSVEVPVLNAASTGTLNGVAFTWPSIAGADAEQGVDFQSSIRIGATKGSTHALDSWTEFSLWDLIGNVDGAQTVKKQYYDAQRISVTGFSALLRNTTAADYKSGSVVAAQLPGGAEDLVPTQGEQMYRFLASYNDPKSYSGQLNEGVHWFFAPEKIQDWFFVKQQSEQNDERPFLAIAWSGVAVNDLANMLGLVLDLKLNIELLSTDISLIKFMPTADLTRLMDLYVSMVSAHNPLGENPDHKSKIRKIAKSFINSPITKDAFNRLLSAGQTLIPLALAAIGL